MPHNSKSEGMGYGTKYAVRSVEIYQNDVVVKWADRKRSGGKINGEERKSRGGVVEFSEDSRKRLAFVASNTPVEFTTMVTLTYPADYPADGREVKGHLNRFLSWVRSVGSGEYLWFLEFQKRGAPHFHVLLDHDIDKGDVSRRWYEAVGSGDERHLRAGTRVERVRSVNGARRYVVKYGMKMAQKECPDDYNHVGRFWGHSKGVKPKPVMVSKEAMSQADLMDLVDGWEYVGILDKKPVSTLYNAAGLVAGKIASVVDQLHGTV